MKTVYILKNYSPTDLVFGPFRIAKFGQREMTPTEYAEFSSKYPTQIATQISLKAMSVHQSQAYSDDTDTSVLTPTQLNALAAPLGGKSAYGAGFKRRMLQHAPIPFGTGVIDQLVSAGATMALTANDSTVTWNGRNTTKVTVTGGGSNTVMEVGVSTAALTADDEVQAILQRAIMAAVKITGNTLVNATLYIGVSGYTSFHTFDLTPGSTVNGWQILTKETPGSTATTNGPVNLTGAVQAKLRLTFTANVAPGTVQIGGVYVIPQPQPTVVLMFDDGYTEWLWLAAEAKKRGIPMSFGIAMDYIGTPGFLTEDEVKAIANDPSGLFEMTNHCRVNTAYNVAGFAAYTQAMLDTRDYLVNKLGLSYKSASCHQYVQGIFDQTLINWMKANGFICGREVGSQNRRALIESIALVGPTADELYKLPATTNLENGYTVATAKQHITTAARSGAAISMGHRFENTAGTIKWIKGYDSQYGILDLLDWLALMRDTQGWRIMRLSDWVSDVTTPGYMGSALLP